MYFDTSDRIIILQIFRVARYLELEEMSAYIRGGVGHAPAQSPPQTHTMAQAVYHTEMKIVLDHNRFIETGKFTTGLYRSNTIVSEQLTRILKVYIVYIVTSTHILWLIKLK